MSGSGDQLQAGARHNRSSHTSKNSSSSSFQSFSLNKKRQAARGNSPPEKRTRTSEHASNGRDTTSNGPGRPSGGGARPSRDAPPNSALHAVKSPRYETQRPQAERALPASGASTPVSEAPPVPRMVPGHTRPTARTPGTANKATPDSHQKRMREQGIVPSPRGIASIVAVRKAKSLQVKQASVNPPNPPQENGPSVGFQSQQQLEAMVDDLVARKLQSLRQDILDQVHRDFTKQYGSKDSNARDVVGRASQLVEQTCEELRDFETKYTAHGARLDSFDTRLNARLGQLDELKQDMKVANDKYNASIYRIEKNMDQLSGQCKSLAALQDNQRKLEHALAEVQNADPNKLKNGLKLLNDRIEPILGHETTLAQIQPLAGRLELLESKSTQLERNLSELSVPVQETQKTIDESIKRLDRLTGTVTELRRKQTELETTLDKSQSRTLESRMSTGERAKSNSGHVENPLGDRSASPRDAENIDFKNRFDLLEKTLKGMQSQQMEQKDRLVSTETGVDENFGAMDERITELETKVEKLQEVMIAAAQTAVKPTKDLVNSIQDKLSSLEQQYAGPDQNPNIAFVLRNWLPLAANVQNLKLAVEDLRKVPHESAQKPQLSEDRITQLITEKTQSMQDAMTKLEGSLLSSKGPATGATSPGPEMDDRVRKLIEDRLEPLSELNQDMRTILAKAEQDTRTMTTSTAAQLKLLQAAVSQLQQSFRVLQEKHDTWRKQGDTQFLGMQHNHSALVTALADLETRYQNITTDSIYKRMVHWVQEQYPDAPNFLAAVNQIRADMGALREQVSNGNGNGTMDSGDTARLRQEVDALKRQVANSNRDGSIEGTARLQQEVTELKASLNGAIDSLIRECGERRTAIDALETKITTVQDDLAKSLRGQMGTREELAKNITELQEQISGMDKRLADLGDDLAAESTKLENEDKVLSNRIAQIEGPRRDESSNTITAEDIQKLSTKLAKVDKLIELKADIEQICGQLPFLESTLGKMQHDIRMSNQYIRALNESSPRRPLGDMGEVGKGR